MAEFRRFDYAENPGHARELWHLPFKHIYCN